MDDTYIVNFIKDKDYRRFYASGILTNINNHMCSIDFYEETLPLMTRYEADPVEGVSIETEDGNLINYLHASILVSLDNIPNIINALQLMYDKHSGMKDDE